MEKNSTLFYKILVFGVIVFFIGVGIQPAFAITSDTSENEDDCELCRSINIQHLIVIKSLLNRLKFANNIILFNFGDKPEIKKKCEELSIKITKFNEIPNQLTSNSWIPGQITFCILFAVLFILVLIPNAILDTLAYIFPLFFPIYELIYYAILWPIYGIIFTIYDRYNCDEIFINPFPW